MPFRRLGSDDLRAIARQAIGDVFAREGLARRRCLLAVEDRALDPEREGSTQNGQAPRRWDFAVIIVSSDASDTRKGNFRH